MVHIYPFAASQRYMWYRMDAYNVYKQAKTLGIFGNKTRPMVYRCVFIYTTPLHGTSGESKKYVSSLTKTMFEESLQK